METTNECFFTQRSSDAILNAFKAIMNSNINRWRLRRNSKEAPIDDQNIDVIYVYPIF